MENKKIRILLIEDNEGDVLLTKKAFEQTTLDHEIIVASDGEIALQLLKHNDDNSSLFDLILLDLSLPKIDGKDILVKIKNDKKLCSIPVVMLSGSKKEIDIVKSYDLKANSYIIKGNNIEEFKKIAVAIETCWINALKK